MINKKQKWIIPLSVVLLCLSIFACRKELQIANEEKQILLKDPKVKMDINLSKLFYKELKKERGDAVNMELYLGANSKRMSTSQNGIYDIVNRKYLFFKKAYVLETALSTFTEVPVLYNQRFSSIISIGENQNSALENQEIFAASFDRMIIYKNKLSGKTNFRMVTFIPNIEYLRRHKNDISHNHINSLDDDFDGFLEYKDWDGNPLYLLQYTNGTRTKIINLKNKVDKTKAKSSMQARGTICTTYDVEIWGESCVTADPEGGYQSCSPYLISSYSIESCYDDGDDPITPPVDPPYEGYDPCLDLGQCDNGGTPPVDNGSSRPPLVLNFSDRIKYPTLAKIVDGLKEKVINNSKLMDALKKFSTLSESQILENLTPGKGPEIIVVDTLSSTVYGEYSNIANTLRLNNMYVAELNTIYPDRASMFEFFLVSTIFHEFVHFGNDLNNNYLPKIGTFDIGKQFENEIYGGDVSYDQTTGKLKYTKMP